MPRASWGGEDSEDTHFCWPGVLKTCPQSRQVSLLSEGVKWVAGDSAPKDCGVIMDEFGEVL